MKRFSLFEAFGIELEYMLVNSSTLDVSAVADRVLETAAGHPSSDFEFDGATWSNELALHVLELKGTNPESNLVLLGKTLSEAILAMQASFSPHDVILLPTAMHPWMDPRSESKLWPYECSEIYAAYHRVFDCFRHGWANVQSVHLNLPFASDVEFSQLHAAVRLVLPILPALTASSPIVDSKPGTWLNMRMQFVRDHCDVIPFLTGDMVPEPIFDEANYRREIFSRLEEVIRPHDPDGVFDPNFLNARGAIARFDRGSVEIRVMDVQEYPTADLAVCVATIAVLKALVYERWQSLDDQKRMPTAQLSGWLNRVAKDAENTVIDDDDYLRHFGVTHSPITAAELWSHLLEEAEDQEPMMAEFRPTLAVILEQGTVASRILRAVDRDFRRERLRDVYRELNVCLTEGKPFVL